MLVKTEEYKGFTIKLHIDENPRNPREEYDYFSTMLCWHSQYSLGDDNPYRDPDEAWEYITESRAVVLPLYLYDHSGLSMSTSRSYPFNDPWDAGQVGWIFIEREKVLKEYSRKKRDNEGLWKGFKVEIGDGDCNWPVVMKALR